MRGPGELDADTVAKIRTENARRWDHIWGTSQPPVMICEGCGLEGESCRCVPEQEEPEA